MNLEISQANKEKIQKSNVFLESFTKSGHDVIFWKAQAWLVALLADTEQCLWLSCVGLKKKTKK